MFTGFCCSEPECRGEPMHGCRFCRQHQHLERICAAFLPPMGAGITRDCRPRMRRLVNSFLPHGTNDNPPVQGQFCGRQIRSGVGSIVCDSPLCNHVVNLLKHRGQADEQLPTDRGDRDKRERERAWQLIHAQQRVHRKEVVGHFFYVCPCGVPTFDSSVAVVFLCMLQSS
jgi:hypothetical protein